MKDIRRQVLDKLFPPCPPENADSPLVSGKAFRCDMEVCFYSCDSPHNNVEATGKTEEEALYNATTKALARGEYLWPHISLPGAETRKEYAPKWVNIDLESFLAPARCPM